jgi:hypothetical protein
MPAGQGPVIFTGNNVDIQINGLDYGFVETLTISRSVNRRPAYAVGSPLFVDAPVTQATVTVQATNLVPINGNNALSAGNTAPTESLAKEVNASAGTINVLQQGTGTLLYQVTNAFYNQDSVQVPNTDIFTYNLSWTAQDTLSFVL